jgi:hypothetical protein
MGCEKLVVLPDTISGVGCGHLKAAKTERDAGIQKALLLGFQQSHFFAGDDLGVEVNVLALDLGALVFQVERLDQIGLALVKQDRAGVGLAAGAGLVHGFDNPAVRDNLNCALFDCLERDFLLRSGPARVYPADRRGAENQFVFEGFDRGSPDLVHLLFA